MPTDRKDPTEQEILIEEKKTKPNGEVYVRKYIKGRFLGKGGFAKCYEFTCTETKQPYAAKLLPKSSLTKSRARQKLLSEIKIHRSLKHKHVVGFQHFFEDHDNVYILLELCTNQTLNEIIRRRKRLHELEVQCYVVQMVSALKYLHAHKVIHRDLKLGNLFVNDKMEIKIGDFGLATKLEFEGDRKRTICGTPNYIAPEILEGKNGHSYEVDIWSLGVIIYTLLIGKPPFETSDVKTTYKKIRLNSYTFPDNIKCSREIKDLISSILHLDPAKRPNLTQILEHEFFHMNAAIPKALPAYTLACPPSESYTTKFKTGKAKEGSKHKLKRDKSKYLKTVPQTDLDPLIMEAVKGDTFVVEYVDYSSKYGVGYILSNGTFGVFYNDSTKIIFDPSSESIEYVNKKSGDKSGRIEKFYSKEYPAHLKKKMTLLQHFTGYLEKNIHAKRHLLKESLDDEEKSIVVKKWLRTKHAIIFRLSNKLVQVIFFDNTEIILHSENRAVTYVNKKGERLFYSIESSIESNNQEMTKRLNYTRQVLTHMLQNKFGASSYPDGMVREKERDEIEVQ